MHQARRIPKRQPGLRATYIDFCHRPKIVGTWPGMCMLTYCAPQALLPIQYRIVQRIQACTARRKKASQRSLLWCGGSRMEVPCTHLDACDQRCCCGLLILSGMGMLSLDTATHCKLPNALERIAGNPAKTGCSMMIAYGWPPTCQ